MATSILTSQSDKLIKLTVGLGFVVSMCSALVIIGLIIHYFTTSAVTSGWSSIIATICLMEWTAYDVYRYSWNLCWQYFYAG